MALPSQYAYAGLGRAGEMQANWHTGEVFVSIGGVPYQTLGARIPIEPAMLVDTVGEEPTTGQLTLLNVTPSDGLDIIITLGSINNLAREFGGRILRRRHFSLTSDKTRYDAHALSLIDYTWDLDGDRISGHHTGTATEILEALLTAHAPADFSWRIEQDLPTVPGGITFTNLTLRDCISQLTNRMGLEWLADYRKVVRVFSVDRGGTPPLTITETNPLFQDFWYDRDLSQVISRAYVEGGGAQSLADVPVGETILPVTIPDWYADEGGVVVSGPQRIAYTGRLLGGGGGLVGPGALPSAAPDLALALTGGAGLEAGLRDYAATFVTAAGESLPSPIASIAPGFVAPPVAASVEAILGGAVDDGDHYYAINFWTPSDGYTAAGVLARVTTGAILSAGVVTPPIDSMSTAQFDAGTPYWNVGDSVSVAVTYRNANGETTASDWTSPQTMGPSLATPGWTKILTVTGIPVSADPSVTSKRLYVRINGVARGYISVSPATHSASINGPGNAPNSPPFTNTATLTGPARTVRLTNIPKLPAPFEATGRRDIWRTKVGSSVLWYVASLLDNTTEEYTDTASDASLSAFTAPSSTTLKSNAVAGSDVPLGPPGTLSRNIYRNAAGASGLQLALSIANNTDSTFTDTTPDGSLGAAAPTVDSSGLSQPAGQVLAGATSLPIAGTGAFSAGGGWAVIGNGQQTIRYTGKTATALTGIPATGPGSIAASIGYNSTATAAPSLTGIPASGEGSIQYAILKGDDVNIWIQRDDADAEALLGRVRAGYIQDRRLARAEAEARADALIAKRGVVTVTVGYTTRDLNTQAGKPVAVAMGDPFNITGDFLIQSVTETFDVTQPATMPFKVVTASNDRFTFEQLLRMGKAA